MVVVAVGDLPQLQGNNVKGNEEKSSQGRGTLGERALAILRPNVQAYPPPLLLLAPVCLGPPASEGSY